jgi:hypothetical protein
MRADPVLDILVAGFVPEPSVIPGLAVSPAVPHHA